MLSYYKKWAIYVNSDCAKWGALYLLSLSSRRGFDNWSFVVCFK